MTILWKVNWALPLRRCGWVGFRLTIKLPLSVTKPHCWRFLSISVYFVLFWFYARNFFLMHIFVNLRICINVYSKILLGKWFYWIHFWSIHPAELVYTSFYSWGKAVNVTCGLLETNFPLSGLYPSTFFDLRFLWRIEFYGRRP